MIDDKDEAYETAIKDITEEEGVVFV